MFPLTCNAAHRRTTDMTRIHRRQFLTRSRNLGVGRGRRLDDSAELGIRSGCSGQRESHPGLDRRGRAGQQPGHGFRRPGRLPFCLRRRLRLRPVCEPEQRVG